MKRKIAEILNVIFGFRKFILMLILFMVGIAFRISDLITGAEMVDLFKNTTIAFFSANGVEHLVGAVKEYAASKSGVPATPELADTDESNDEEEVEPKEVTGG